MKKRMLMIAPIIILIILGFMLLVRTDIPTIRVYQEIDRFPQIFPDYKGIVIPNNIAPINFEIKEPGDHYLVKIKSEKGDSISLYQENAAIEIPLRAWSELLSVNKNERIQLEIYIEKEGQWYRFKTIENYISEDPIDPFVYYRDIVPTNSYWNKMAMHQRDMGNFDEHELFNNHRTDHNCMNCHTFNQNNPDQMLFHVRGKHSGTVFYNKGKLSKVNLKTPEALSAGAYCSWHPSGKVVALATNKIKQNYYLSGHENKMKEVFDLASDIVLYNVETNTVFSFPQISSAKRENLPCWSADGKFLYYTQAREYEVDLPNEENLYSLMRVRYDLDSNSMGVPEVLISDEETNKSIAFPTVSPNGKYLFFCLVDFGYFPVNNKTSDLYLMDLKTNQYYKPDINSDESESYVSWSSNSKWFVFSSRRLDGMTSKPFLCHIDLAGKISKPFILPQEDPLFYTIDHRNFARPELIKEKFKLDFGDLEKVIFGEASQALYDSTSMIGNKN